MGNYVLVTSRAHHFTSIEDTRDNENIEFVNHACIKTELVMARPSFESMDCFNAFGGGTRYRPQDPKIFNIIDTDERMGVIISHGHEVTAMTGS